MDSAAWRTAFTRFLEAPAKWDFLLEWARRSQCLPVYCDWTHAFGVTEHGDVIAFEHEERPGYDGPREGKLTDLRLLNVALYRGMKRHAWLEELLPPRPAAAQDCSSCGGTGAAAAANLTCYCGGAGWVPAGDTWVDKGRLAR